VFAIITMAYHVMLDQTWNPLQWQRRHDPDLQHPEPITVTRRPRAGKLELPNEEEVLTRENAWAIWTFVWAWIK
jgi:hypothetical protein